MANTGSKITMKILTVAISIPVGIAIRRTVEKVWMATGADRPARSPGEAERWGDAIGWAALTGMAMGVADLVARKSAEELWHTVVGSRAPVQTRPTASKRVRKATPKHPERVAPPN
jgi:hypothetical protein